MANSTTHLDTIAASQANKEVSVNALLDAASPAMLYGRRAVTTAGLTWGYYGGTASVAGAPTTIANGTVTLAASATNYVEADPATGAVSANTTGFTSGRTPLYSVVTGASTVSSYTDLRVLGGATVAAPTAQPFDIHTFYPGKPTASARLYRGKLARAVTWPANFAGAQFTATANATASTVFDVQKNGVSVGSCTIAAGGTTATFATTGGAAVNFAAGDIFEVIAPASADATLADPAITFAGTR